MDLLTFWAEMALALLVAISGPKKVSIFQGPSLSNGPRNWIFLHKNHYVPCHTNNRYINSYTTAGEGAKGGPELSRDIIHIIVLSS
jgi:hypothetical protein